MAISCRQRYQKIIRIVRFCSLLVGADIIDESYRMNWLTKLVVVATLSFFLCTIYTIHEGLVLRGDWTVILQALCMVGSAVQGLVKLVSVLIHREILRTLLRSLDSIYFEYEQKRSGYKVYLNRNSNFIRNLMIFISLVYSLGVTVIVCYPLVHRVLFKERIFVMQFLLPGIDAATNEGYLLHIGSHIMCLSFGAFGNFAGDMYIFLFIRHIPLLKDILHCKFEDLNEALEGSHGGECMHSRIVDIVVWHQKYTSITDSIRKVFSVVIFVQIFTTVSGITCTTFIIFLGVWPAAFAYLIYSFVILYTYCGLGTQVDIANDECTDIIYNDCLWYKLPTSQQQMIKLMIQKSQAPIMLTIGGIMPLSVPTALQLTKAVYSILMILLNFVEQ